MSRREFYLVLHDITDNTEVYFTSYSDDRANPVAQWSHDVTRAIEMSQVLCLNTQTMVRLEPWFNQKRFTFREEAAPRPRRWLACPICGRSNTTEEDLPRQSCGADLPNRKRCPGKLEWYS